jgi:hypothetical protein
VLTGLKYFYSLGKKLRKMACRSVEHLAKDLFNTKAIYDKGWSKKERWRRTLGLAEDWQEQQNGMKVVKVKNTMASLKKSLVGTRGKLEKVFGGDYSKFTKYASTLKHLCILGSDGKVLGYMVRYNASFLSELAASSAQLPPIPLSKTSRGEFEEKHYVVWADYAVKLVPFISLEFKRDEKKNGAASEWMRRNERLIRAVNNARRCIVPGEYSRVVMAGERLEDDLGVKALFWSWFGAAIHQKMSGKYASCLHRDEKDYGLSCLVPSGEYKGGNLVLVQLGIKVELRPGDAFFFRSAHIVHLIEEPKGTRGVVTLFSHANTFTYIDRKRKRS